MQADIFEFTITDYQNVISLWKSDDGIGLSGADSKDSSESKNAIYLFLVAILKGSGSGKGSAGSGEKILVLSPKRLILKN